MTDRPWVRPSARVVVLDPAARILLFGSRLVDPAVPPGGGVEDGESLRQAAARELAEEIGLVVDPGLLEGPVWLRRFIGPFAGVDIDNRETYFVLRDVDHEVAPGELTELEVLAAEPYRWWSREEIATSGQEFAPRELAAVLPELLAGPWTGPPRIVD